MFTRKIGANWAAIALQRSSASDAARLKVTANVGASLASILRFEEHVGPPRSVRGLHWYARLGELTADGYDRWWWIRLDDLPNSASEFAEVVADVGVPVAEAHADDGRLSSLWSAGPVPFVDEVDRLRWLSIVRWSAGDVDSAREALDELSAIAATSDRVAEVRAHVARMTRALPG